jgi:hypothetical protein
MNVADALLLASTAPGQRRLRVTVFPEPSWPLTALVSTGVVSFFLAYLGVLVLFFMVRAPCPSACMQGSLKELAIWSPLLS